MRVALYARVSKNENYQDNRYQELENQLVPLREWAKTMNWEIIDEYSDKASGADSGRQNFRRLMSDAMQRRFSCILVWKMDRFSRENMSNVVAYVQSLKSRGVGIKSMTESWLDTTTENPISGVVLAIMSWAAAEERRKISERTKAGINRLKAIGQWTGGRPINLNNEQSLQAKELFTQGKDIDEIAKILQVDRKVVKHWAKESRKRRDAIINPIKQHSNKAGVFSKLILKVSWKN